MRIIESRPESTAIRSSGPRANTRNASLETLLANRGLGCRGLTFDLELPTGITRVFASSEDWFGLNDVHRRQHRGRMQCFSQETEMKLHVYETGAENVDGVQPPKPHHG